MFFESLTIQKSKSITVPLYQPHQQNQELNEQTPFYFFPLNFSFEMSKY